MSISFHRIDNHEYLYDRPHGRAISVTVSPKMNAELAHQLAHQAVQRISEHHHPKTVRFRYGGKKWKVVPINENTLWQRILRFLNIFSAKPVEGRFDRYRLEVSHRPMKRSKHRVSNVVKNADFEKGVRETILGNSDLSAFTLLAAKAFQKYETYFCPNDDTQLSDLDYRIILQNGELKLVQKESALFNAASSKAAVDAWEKQYIARYGEKKFKDMLRFYKLDMNAGLTAEHVYRANMYATNVDMNDLKTFADRIVKDQPLTGFEEQCLNAWPEVKERLKAVQADFSQLTPVEFSRLCQSFFPSQKQRSELLTGRKINYPISSHYSIGEKGAYKPWIDQQELTEIFPLLEKCKSWESYQELLAHVVVKKHLMRVHSEHDLRLGVLIPAPPKERGGPVRYYQVQGCITNGGILSYILESPCGDPSLPVIKLYRSTARHTSALNSADTLINDLNHLNSPGYLGIRDIDFYEKEFFSKHTIPVWVGYQHQAQQALEKGNPQEARRLLLLSNQALETELRSKIQRPSFAALLKAHDRPINAVFFPYSSDSLKKLLKSRRGDLLTELIKKYLRKKKDSPPDEIKKDALRLHEYLREALQSLNPTDPLYNQIEALRKDLKNWYIDQKQPELPPKDQAILETVKNLAGQKNDMLEAWANMIDAYAVEHKEDIGSKNATDLHLTGHSLGGACAAVAIARYMAINGRMPLPGHQCKGFFFDEPGINAEDNAQFLRYGATHQDLFRKSKVGFSLFRRHESGDVVPVAGGMSLGSTETEADAEKLKQWCHYDAAVNRRKKSAKHLEIAETIAAHGTRFLEAIPGVDYKVKPVTPYEEGLFHRGSNWLLKGEDLKRYRMISKHIWKVGSPLKRMLQENLRTSLKFPLLFLRFKVASAQAEHVLPEELLDQHGAFCKTV